MSNGYNSWFVADNDYTSEKSCKNRWDGGLDNLSYFCKILLGYDILGITEIAFSELSRSLLEFLMFFTNDYIFYTQLLKINKTK